jgi:hypothetical protein
MTRTLTLAVCAILSVAGRAAPAQPAPTWPTITADARPWTRWWWLGSAVDSASLTSELTAYAHAGLGGVEITPIYGVHGAESRFRPYLSPSWMDALGQTLRESRRLGLVVDMATGNGWPFGGPWVGADDASRYVAHGTYTVRGGERLAQPVAFRQVALVRGVNGAPPIDSLRDPIARTPNLQALALDQVRFPKPLPLQALVAYSDAGAVTDLTSRVGADGTLDWVAPPGTWTLHALFAGWHGKQVERAGPGGEGDVIDHFSPTAIAHYLAHFDSAFAGREPRGLHGFFNDSYEVDDASGQADWTPRLLDEFQKRRGYDLRAHLPALFGAGDADSSARVLSDYRETVSDLLLDGFTRGWREWAHRRNAVVRNQAHGSPANILDLYAASDVPETEGTEPLRLKFATSAAHVSGKRLASAEAATWLGEHFLVTLGQVRTAVDRFLLAGVNHIVYHGTAFSPTDAAWPGWQFYAAVEFNPRNPWWTDFGALNAYVARVQSFLQAGTPDADVLLYFPIYDRLATRARAGLLEHFDGPTPNDAPAFRAAADTMLARGVAFDYVSDRQLAQVRAVGGRLHGPGGAAYRAVVIPASRLIPDETLARVVALAEAGATVVVYRDLPADVPGLGDLARRRARLRSLAARLQFAPVAGTHLRRATLGRGAVLLGDDLSELLARAGVRRERSADLGLHLVRRRNADGATYFVVNPGHSAVDAWVPLARAASAAALYDPMLARSGSARVRPAADGGAEVYLQLGPGESRVVRTFDVPRTAAPWRYVEPAGPARPLTGRWALAFESGGPELPPPVSDVALGSWTALSGPAVKKFSGTGVYRLTFPRPAGDAAAWRLDLGEVRESARIDLNGRTLGTLLGPAFSLDVPADALRDENVLEVRVTNLAANRVADLDARGVAWKIFYNTNFPARLRENRGPDGLFSAARWSPLPSGLLGPVTLTPLREKL